MPGTGPRDISALQRDSFGDVEIVARACPLCGAANADVAPNRYSLGAWTAKTCPQCGFVYLDRAPVYEALSEQMNWSDSARLERERRATSRPVMNAVSAGTRWRMRLMPRPSVQGLLLRHARPGNVLDLGCGGGGRMKDLPEGFVPHGIEIGRAAAQAADERFAARGGHAVNAPALEGLRTFPDDFFTAALLRSYLEHELHPADVLSELRRTLVRGGVAVVKVPNFACWNRRVLGLRWCGFRHPDHVNYFTPRTLRALGEQCGYRVRAGLLRRLPLSDNMYAFFTKLSAFVAICC